MNSDQDEKLKAFMNAHVPLAPEAPKGELEQIQFRLGLNRSTSASSLSNRWFTLGGAGALVASFAASWFLLAGPNPASTSVRQTSEEWAVHVLSGDQDDETLPTNDVGEEYLGLLAGR